MKDLEMGQISRQTSRKIFINLSNDFDITLGMFCKIKKFFVNACLLQHVSKPYSSNLCHNES